MDWRRGKVVTQITDLIGQTPIVRIRHGLDPAHDAAVYMKLEYLNPGRSVKDRPAYQMIAAAEAAGVLQPGATIIEPTSGNTGIGLALVAAARGYQAIFVMPDNSSEERRRILRAYGAQVVLTPASERMPGAIQKAEEILAGTPNGFMPAQFDNMANPLAHQLSTGPEVLAQMEGQLDAFVATAGTGGTITGTGEYLKQHLHNLQVFVVEPEQSPVLAGGKPGNHRLTGTSPGFIPQILNQQIYDEILHVSDDDALRVAQALAKQEGILVGPSAGAAAWAAIQIAKRLTSEQRVLCIAPDTGERYLSMGVFNA